MNICKHSIHDAYACIGWPITDGGVVRLATNVAHVPGTPAASAMVMYRYQFGGEVDPEGKWYPMTARWGYYADWINKARSALGEGVSAGAAQ